MNVSNDTTNVLNALDFIAGNSLRKRNDLGIIIEICAIYDGAELLNQLIFTGKSAWNLQNTLKRISDSDEAGPLVKRELSNHIEKMQRQLTQISEKADADTQKRFSDVYLHKSIGAMKNLIDLSFDLSIFKELQNQTKRL